MTPTLAASLVARLAEAAARGDLEPLVRCLLQRYGRRPSAAEEE